MKALAPFKDARKNIEQSISDDRLKFFVSVEPVPGIKDFSDTEILSALGSNVHTSLVDTSVIHDIVTHLNKGEACKERRIAKGRPPEAGKDGRIVWLVKKLGGEGEVQTDERGFADFVQMNLFDNVSPGHKIARIYKPKAGVAGIDVTGKPISPAPVKPFQARTDQTVSIGPVESEHYDVLTAVIAGYAFQDGNTLGIKDTLLVPSDLDYHFGSIDFIGNVSVQGDVHKGFSIQSQKGIEINGSVQGESRFLAKESIQVHGTHFGGPKSEVSTSAWYQVRAAREVRVDADGPIIVERESFDCDFTTRDVVYGPSAKIVGGTIRCVRGVEAGHIGNDTGKITTVHLCVGPEASAAYMKLEQDIQLHDNAARLLTLHLGPYVQLSGRIGNLPELQRTKVKQLFDKLQSVEKSLLTLKARRQNFLETTSDETAFVTVHTMLHEGVKIVRREAEFVCKEPMAGPLTIKFNPQSGCLEKSELENHPDPALQREKKTNRK